MYSLLLLGVSGAIWSTIHGLGDLGDLGDLGGRGCSPEIAAKLDWSRAASLEYSSDHNPQ